MGQETGIDRPPSGTVQFVATDVEQNKTISGETVFIQADNYLDNDASKLTAGKTVHLLVEKGTGFKGHVEGDAVIIKMDDFQLTNLKRVIANVTQLSINKDVIIDQDLVLENTLHLWANKLINRAQLTAKGDFIAQISTDILLNGQIDVKGTAGFIAGTGISSEQGKISAEKLYLQSKAGDISLYKAVVKSATDIRIVAETGSIKTTAAKIKAGKDVDLFAGKNIEQKSLAVRTGDDKNFEEKKDADSIDAGGKLTQEARQYIIRTAVEHKADGAMTNLAGGSIVDMALPLESQHSEGDKKNNRSDHKVTQDVSTYTGDSYLSKAGGDQVLYAPKITVNKKAEMSADGSVIAKEVHDTEEHQSKETQKGGFFGQDRKKKSFSFAAVSKGLQITAGESVEITAGQDTILTNMRSNAPKTKLSAARAVKLLLGTSQSASSYSERSSNMAWNQVKSRVKEDIDRPASTVSGTLEVNAKQVFVEAVQGQALTLAKQLEDQGIKAIYTFLAETHKFDEKNMQGPSAALAVVVVIAITICTYGTGTALGAAAAAATVGATSATATAVITAVTAAAFTSICAQAALALLSNEGNIIKAAESLASTRTLEMIGIAMITAGATAGLSSALNVPAATQATSIGDHAARQGIQTGVYTTSTLIQGAKPEDALKQGLKAGAIGLVSSVAAMEIGEAYRHNDVDFIGHKFLHALLGGATGAALGEKPLEGAAAGAFGAVTAEMIGELVLMNAQNIAGEVADKVVEDLNEKNMPVTNDAIKKAVSDEVARKTDIIKLLTSGAALLLGQDVNIAVFTATTALDNNLTKMACSITENEVFNILRQQGAADLLPRFDTEIPLIEPTQEEKEVAKKILALEALGLNTDDMSPEAFEVFASLLRSAAPLEIFNEDPNLLYKYLSDVHLESYLEGEGINPAGVKKPLKGPFITEQMTVRHGRGTQESMVEAGTKRTSWTPNDVGAVDRSAGNRNHVIVTSEEKLNRHGIETRNTEQLKKDTEIVEKNFPKKAADARNARGHFEKFKEVQTVEKGVPNEAVRKLRFYEGRAPIITNTARKVLPAIGKTLGAVGVLATMTEDSSAGTTVTNQFDPHYGEQAFNEAAQLVERLILSFGGTITYVNQITHEKTVVKGTPFWEGK